MADNPFSHNPFKDEEGNPILRNSVVSYMDILGYHDATVRAITENRAQEFLCDICFILNKGYQWLKPEDKQIILEHRPYLTKIFTDNVVMAEPIPDYSQGELELGSTFLNLQLYQLGLALEGFFVRGAVTVGNLYMDENVVFGEALIDAYNAESKEARDPRILITDSALAYIRAHIKYYTDPTDSPQYIDILTDVDGQCFLNYLQPLVDLGDYPFEDEILKHKSVVEEKLKEFSTNPTIWSKYFWVARYHNYFCEISKVFSDDQYIIKMDDFQLKPGRIL